jgi:WD40 repeat protein
MQVFSGHGASVSQVSFTPDGILVFSLIPLGKLLVSAGEDCTLIVWDPKSGSIVSRFSSDTGRFHRSPVNTFAISQDSQTLV